MNRDEIILNNQNLIYFVLKKLNLYEEHQELFDLGMIGLIKGVDSYKEEKGTLSTYLCRCIYNNILMNFRKKRPITISYEEIIYDNITLADTLTDNHDFTTDIEKNDDLNRIYLSMNNLTKKEKDILIKYFGLFNTKKYRQSEIAKLYNHSQSYIARIINKSIKKIRKEVLHENI